MTLDTNTLIALGLLLLAVLAGIWLWRHGGAAGVNASKAALAHRVYVSARSEWEKAVAAELSEAKALLAVAEANAAQLAAANQTAA